MIYLFKEGKIYKLTQLTKIENVKEKTFVKNIPSNFLELIDSLKKASYQCEGIYVFRNDGQIQIAIVQKNDGEFVQKFALSKEVCILPLSEQFEGFLDGVEE